MEDKIVSLSFGSAKRIFKKKKNHLLVITPHIFVSLKAFFSLQRPHKEYVFIKTSDNL